MTQWRTRDPLDRQNTHDAQPVEHVVDRGAGEGSAELVSFACLADRNDRVCHRRADVGAHDDEDGLTDVEYWMKERWWLR